MSTVLVYNKNIPNSERLMGEEQFKTIKGSGNWLLVPNSGVKANTKAPVKEVKSAKEVKEIVFKAPTKDEFKELHFSKAVATLKQLAKLELFDTIKELTKDDKRSSVIKAVEKLIK